MGAHVSWPRLLAIVRSPACLVLLQFSSCIISITGGLGEDDWLASSHQASHRSVMLMHARLLNYHSVCMHVHSGYTRTLYVSVEQQGGCMYGSSSCCLIRGPYGRIRCPEDMYISTRLSTTHTPVVKTTNSSFSMNGCYD